MKGGVTVGGGDTLQERKESSGRKMSQITRIVDGVVDSSETREKSNKKRGGSEERPGSGGKESLSPVEGKGIKKDPVRFSFREASKTRGKRGPGFREETKEGKEYVNR